MILLSLIRIYRFIAGLTGTGIAGLFGILECYHRIRINLKILYLGPI
nr:hypothetical protein CJLB15_00080 [Campylobacter phage CJLB-15]